MEENQGQVEFFAWLEAEITKKNGGRTFTPKEMAELLHYSVKKTIERWKEGKDTIPKLVVHFLCLRFGLDWDVVREKAETMINAKDWRPKPQDAKERRRELKTIRKSLKLRQLEFGQALGLSRQWVCYMEKGEYQISDDVLAKAREMLRHATSAPT